MSRYWPEPPFKHGSPARTGVLPRQSRHSRSTDRGRAAALPEAVPVRPARGGDSAARCGGPSSTASSSTPGRQPRRRSTPACGPTKAHRSRCMPQRQSKLLAGYLAKAGHAGLDIDYAMRYGAPAIPDVLNAMRARGCTRILVLPLYPQYSASTSATVVDEVGRCLAHWRNQPEIRFVRNFHDHPGYIAALVRSVREHWMVNGEPERLLLSFHGVPRRSLDLGDPYHCECHKTGRLVAEGAGHRARARAGDLPVALRQGRMAQALHPAHARVAGGAGRQAGRCDVPGFVADCLETLEEIAMECKEAFLEQGRPALPLHSLPQRERRLDQGTRRPHSRTSETGSACAGGRGLIGGNAGRARALGAGQ